MSSENYDVVIVGGGLAGLVLANRLSEDPTLRVIVLESGKDRSGDPNTLTPGAWPLLTQAPSEWAFQPVPHKNIVKQSIIPQGRALGGSSAINSFLFTSTSKANVDTWEKLGNEGWSFPAFDKALRKSFTLHKPGGITEGDGPLQVTMKADESVWEKSWIEGLGSIGFERADALSGRLCGPNITPESIDPKTKQRSYATNAYLDPIRDRPNLTTRTETIVIKVLFDKPSSGDKPRAKGVQVIAEDKTVQTIRAHKEVIICAGAFNSPRILERSGVGNAELLQRLGIDVVVDNPHVGENLQNHVYTGLAFEVHDDADTLDAFFRQEPAALAAAMQDYGTKGTGPMSTSNTVTKAQLPLREFHTEEGRKELDQLFNALDADAETQQFPPTTPAFAAAHKEFVRSIAADPTESLGSYVFGAAYAPFEATDPMYRAPGKWVSAAIELSHPLSRGSVHITSADPEHASTGDGVAVDFRYLSNPLDLEVLARLVRFTEDFMTGAEPIARHLKPYTKRFADLGAAKEYVRRTADGAHHYTGTCSMMAREMGGVVDSRLRVYGAEKLRVLDASIVPLEPTANPQAVVYAVAELGAGFIKEDLQCV